MLLLEPEETAYDLRWRMFGTPVRVHPMFWLIALILGDGAFRLGVQYLLAWVGCVFVSILLHEFGHVWMGRLFGSEGYIVLYSFGGLAIGSNRLAYAWQRILVLLAGPGIQLAFFGLISTFGERIIVRVPPSWSGLLSFTVFQLIWINKVWAIVNLLPIWPLDGGQIMRELCQLVLRQRGVVISLGISMVVSGLLALHILMASRGRPLLPYVPAFSMMTALFFALFCINSFTSMQAENASRSRWDRDEWV